MNTEILIIGGGVPGLTLALLLGQAGAEVCVVDTEKLMPMKDVEVQGRTAALMDGSVGILRRVGVWDAMEPYVEGLQTLRIVDDSRKGLEPVQIDFHASDIGLEAYGYNTPNAMLRAALCEAIKSVKSITHLTPARLTSYEVDGAKVIATLDDGKTVEARVIVGADGRRSVTRESAGIGVSEQDYKQSAITCVIDHTKSHENISTEFHRPGGPFTTVPMPGNRSSIVWMEKTEDAERFAAMSKQAFEKALQERTNNTLGQITLSAGPQTWPIITQHAKALTAPRCVLVAEAAHVLSPIGAQGLNLSLRDVDVLANTLLDAMRIGEDVGSAGVLERYTRQRKADINTRVYGIDILNRLVSNNIEPLKLLRRAGIQTLDNLPLLKDFITTQGLNPSSSLRA